jgi:hypothetical protein
MSSSITYGIIFLDFFKSLLPISHSVFAIMMLYYFLQVLSLVTVNHYVPEFIFGLDAVSLIHNLNVHVYLKIYI